MGCRQHSEKINLWITGTKEYNSEDTEYSFKRIVKVQGMGYLPEAIARLGTMGLQNSISHSYFSRLPTITMM